MNSVFAALFLLLPLSSCKSDRTEVKDGVVFVRNPGLPRAVQGGPQRLELVHDLTIGESSDDESRMIFELRALQVDSRGNIYVLDDKIDQVKVYGPGGEHLRTFGQHGQGPGEFQNLSRMTMTSEENLVFLDVGNNRVSTYSPEGECLKEIPMTKWRPYRVLWDSRGIGYGDILDFTEGVSNQLLKFDGKLMMLETIATLTIASNPDESMVPLDLFRLIYRVNRLDHLIWASTGEYELHVVDPEGNTVRRIRRDIKHTSYTREDRDRLIQSLFGDKGPPTGANLFLPDHRPVLYYFILDEEGRIFARTYETDDQGDYYYDIFDEEGRFFTRIALPEEELITVIKDGKAYCSILENEEGIPQVKRYTMVWH